MTNRMRELLFEAYRRNEMRDSHESSKALGDRWLGLGTEAGYRPAIQAGFMVFHDRRTPPPRCMGWLTLTPAGIKAMNACTQKRHDETTYDNTLSARYMLAGGFTA